MRAVSLPRALRRLATRFDRGDDLRAYRAALAIGAYRREVVAHALERAGEWAYTIGLVVLAYELTANVAVAALLLLAHLTPRFVLAALGRRRLRLPVTAGTGGGVARALLLVVLASVATRADLWWATPAVVGLGALTALGDVERAARLPALVPRGRLMAVTMLTGRVEQVALLAGALLTAGAVHAWDVRAAFPLGAVLLLGAAILRPPARAAAPPAAPGVARGVVWRALGGDATLRALLAGLFAGAALGMCLRVLLVEVVVGHHGYAAAFYAGLLAVVAVGALAGPAPIPRLLGKLPARLAAVALAAALAAAVALIGASERFAVIAPVLFLCGLLAITNDLLSATVTRRLTRPDQLSAAFGILAGAVVTGQAVALALVVGSAAWLDARQQLLAAGVGCALLVALVGARGARAGRMA